MPPDRHDFLHCKPYIALYQHDRLLPVTERELVVDLVRLYRLPYKIPHLVMFALPWLGRGDLLRIICLLIFRSFFIKVCLAQVVEQSHDDQAFVRDLCKNRLPYRTFLLSDEAVVNIKAVLQETTFTSQVKARGGRSFVEIRLVPYVFHELVDAGPLDG